MPELAQRDGLRVVLAQLAPVDGDVEANVERLGRVVAAQPSADLAVFPELFLTGYSAGTQARLARTVDDPSIDGVRAVAQRMRTAIVVGFSERGDDGAVHNAALCVDRDGAVAAVHRKTHLFGPGEAESFVAGERLHVVELAGRRIAPLICFEIEFPEPARSVAAAGAELIVTIAANMAPYGRDHDLASRARALDNRVPHVYVNRVGREPGLRFVGGSQVVDAGGGLLASAGCGEAIVARELALGGPVPGDTDYLRQMGPPLPVAEVGPVVHGA